ncbi:MULTISPECIES: S-layer protein [Microcoleus]|uniref:S-layer protein n=1 Tax=Microcoleus TaxID=44471 RepID=UPI0030C98263
MFKNRLKALALGLIAVITSLILVITATTFRTPATAAESNTEQVSSKQIQVRSVSELRDVSPTDWVFQSIQSLVERYQMTALAYPDRSFRGKRDITRGELAQWFQSMVNAMESLRPQATGNLATQEDLADLQQSLESLQQSVQELQQSHPSSRPRI